MPSVWTWGPEDRSGCADAGVDILLESIEPCCVIGGDSGPCAAGVDRMEYARP